MMQQDKNFHIRLRAAVEKRLKEHGLISKYGVKPTHDKDQAYTDKQMREWAFIESLDEITLDYLQGNKKAPVETRACNQAEINPNHNNL